MRRAAGSASKSASRVRVSTRRLSRISEIAEHAYDVAVMVRRRRRATCNPIEKIPVFGVEQRLIATELRVGKGGKMPLGERPEQQVGLLGAAMPAAKQQALAA